MTCENLKKPECLTAKSVELAERVRSAAAVKFTENLTDAELAARFKVSPHTIPGWKKRKEWTETVRQLSAAQQADCFIEMRAMSSAAREVLFELMRNGPPDIRMKIAMTICEWAIKTSL